MIISCLVCFVFYTHTTKKQKNRSASFSATTGECSLSDMDRFSVTARSAYTNTPDVDYFETNCVDDPVKMCDFQRTEGRILKTVDAVFQVTSRITAQKKNKLKTPIFIARFLWIYKYSSKRSTTSR